METIKTFGIGLIIFIAILIGVAGLVYGLILYIKFLELLGYTVVTYALATILSLVAILFIYAIGCDYRDMKK